MIIALIYDLQIADSGGLYRLDFPVVLPLHRSRATAGPRQKMAHMPPDEDSDLRIHESWIFLDFMSIDIAEHSHFPHFLDLILSREARHPGDSSNQILDGSPIL